MIGALLYLQTTSLGNQLSARLRRLKRPRYLIAALVGFAYFYFLFLRGPLRHAGPEQASIPSIGSVHGHVLAGLIGGLFLFIAVMASWILPGTGGALRFSEAEVAHLFPAPITRRTLLHYKLLKSQFSILLSMVLVTLVSNRSSFLGGSVWQHAAGWWLIAVFYNLHAVGASFTRERLRLAGLGNWRRRGIAIGFIALIAGGTWLWSRLPAPTLSGNDSSDITSLLDYARRGLSTPPLDWVLYPFRLVVQPFLARDFLGFLAASLPAIALILAEYLWVMRAETAFEEASVELARKRSEARARSLDGKSVPKSERQAPFELEPVGAPALAFLWKSLLAAGPFYYPQYWFAAGLLLVGGVWWFGLNPVYRPLVGVVVAFSTAVAAYGLLLGPILARRGLALMLQRLDLTKSFPLAGWQVVLGEISSPVLILSMFEWVLLSLLATASYFLQNQTGGVPTSILLASWLGACLLLVPISALLFALNYAGALYFPGWITSAVEPGGGFEKVGHRLIFFVGYMFVLILALLPAALFATIPVFLCLFFGLDALAILSGSVIGCAVLVAEVGAAIWWLGQRFDSFDVSVELAP